MTTKKKGPTHPPKRAPEPTRAGETENRIAAALHDLRRSKSDDAPLDDFREELFSELRKLIPVAIAQARGSKKSPPRPALLRILTRYSR
jgi:hypothetical protein